MHYVKDLYSKSYYINPWLCSLKNYRGFNFIYVLLCFVLCFYIWFWIAFRIIAGGKTASPSSEAWFNRWILGWLVMSLFCMHLVLLSASCYIWSLLDFYYFVFRYFFSISFWCILMFFHLIILIISYPYCCSLNRIFAYYLECL